MYGARRMWSLGSLKLLRRCTCWRCAARWCAISLWPWCCWSFAPPALMPTVVSCHVQATCSRRRVLLAARRVDTLLCSALRSCGACLLPPQLHRRRAAADALRGAQLRLLTPCEPLYRWRRVEDRRGPLLLEPSSPCPLPGDTRCARSMHATRAHKPHPFEQHTHAPAASFEALHRARREC